MLTRSRSIRQAPIWRSALWLLLLVAPSPVDAQQFIKTYGSQLDTTGVAYQAATADGGLVLTGTVFTGIGMADSFNFSQAAPYRFDGIVLKVNASGDVQWQRTYAVARGLSLGSIIQTRDGGYAVIGGTASLRTGPGVAHFLKLDATGKIEWQNVYGGADTSDDRLGFSGLAQTVDGGYVVIGASSAGALALKLDPSGNIEWQNAYAASDFVTLGAVVPSRDGGYIVAGRSGFSGAGASLSRALLLRLDATGHPLWRRTYGTADASVHSVFSIIREAPDRTIVAVGSSDLSGTAQALFMRLDPSGDILSQVVHGRAGTPSSFTGLSPTPDGGYLAVGPVDLLTRAWLVKLDGSGALVWERSFGAVGGVNAQRSPARGDAAAAPGDGGYLTGGSTGANVSTGGDVSQQAFALRVDRDGAIALPPGTSCSAGGTAIGAVTLPATLTGTSLSTTVTPVSIPVTTGLALATAVTPTVITACPGYPLTFARAGTGGPGGVASSLPGAVPPVCFAGTCALTLGAGTAFTLTPAPDAVSTFAGWSGSCAGTGPCLVVMDQARSVTATFAAPSVPAPASKLQAFVVGLYTSFLGRGPTVSELASAIATLTAAPTIDTARQLVHGLFDGVERLGQPVSLTLALPQLYRGLLGRLPSGTEVASWADYLLFLFEPGFAVFSSSPEFTSRLPSVDDPAAVAAMITGFYRSMLGRGPIPSEVGPWVGFLGAGGDPDEVMELFFGSLEYQGEQPWTWAQHVAVLYQTFLGRLPTPPETSPWVDFFVGGVVVVEDLFLNSPEFRSRFEGLSR